MHMHGHWARECNTARQTQVQAPRGRLAGGFSVQGNHTLCTALSTGRTYDARGLFPYPSVWCNGMHWSFHPWHQAPGMGQHLIGALLSELPDTQVVIVQHLDDILFVGRGRLLTTQVACDTAAHLARKGFLVNPKSVLDAT